jgi:hypothetical protein
MLNTIFRPSREPRGMPQPAPDAQYTGQLRAIPSELVFIMGCHRSGTSLLYHLLAYTGQVDYISAYDIIKYNELLHNRVTDRETKVKADLQGLLQQETSRGLDELPVGTDLPEDYRFLMPQDDPAVVLNVGKRLDELFFTPHLTPTTLPVFLDICRKKRFLAVGDRPLVLKNPADYYFNFWAVHRMLPQAKFIFIHRHPLTTFNSYLYGFTALLARRSNYAALIDRRYQALFDRLWLRRRMFLKAFRSDMVCRLLITRLVQSYQYYMAHIQKLPAEQYVLVRYEDLCADPVACLSQIGSHLRLHLSPRIPNRFIDPRYLPVLDRVKRHYASRVVDITPYLRHCHYPAWPKLEGAARSSVTRTNTSDYNACIGTASA